MKEFHWTNTCKSINCPSHKTNKQLIHNNIIFFSCPSRFYNQIPFIPNFAVNFKTTKYENTFLLGFGNLDYNSRNNKQKENDNTASDDSKIWNELPTVAAEVKTNGTTLMVCDWTAVKDSIHLPLSYFIEDLEIVKLDNKDEALVKKQ